MDLSQYLLQASRIPMLQDLQQETRELVCGILLNIAKRSVLAKGDVLYTKRAQDPDTGALLVEGALKVTTGDGEPLTVNAPDLLGEMQLFDEHGRRSATVTAAEDSVILEFAWADFVGATLPVLTREQQLEVKEMLTKHAAARLTELDALAAGEAGTRE